MAQPIRRLGLGFGFYRLPTGAKLLSLRLVRLAIGAQLFPLRFGRFETGTLMVAIRVDGIERRALVVTVGLVEFAFGSLALTVRAFTLALRFPFAFRSEGVVASAIQQPGTIASGGNIEPRGTDCAVTLF